MLDQANNQTGRLRQQNQMLRNIGNSLAGVAERVLTSSGLVKNIDRRHLEDKILVYAGMFLTLLLLFGLYIWLKWL